MLFSLASVRTIGHVYFQGHSHSEVMSAVTYMSGFIFRFARCFQVGGQLTTELFLAFTYNYSHGSPIKRQYFSCLAKEKLLIGHEMKFLWVHMSAKSPSNISQTLQKSYPNFWNPRTAEGERGGFPDFFRVWNPDIFVT